MEISQLSEEEIIKIISDDIIGYQVGYEEYEEAVKGLLDLYKQVLAQRNELAMNLSDKEDELKQEKENYKRLSIEAQATAFDEDNKDTEGLCRVLLKQGQITLENGEYKRKDFDWEQNLTELGLMKKREKMFYFPDDECLDEYTKQLEIQLREYQKLKDIFRKHNITNETMYDGFCRLESELEQEKEKNKKDENTFTELGKVLGQKIYEDKIKAKIEQMEQDIKYSANPLSIDNSKYVIQVLQELLEGD